MNLDGTVPADNPLRDGAGPNVDEIWAYGFRNPYRASFDRTTGLYWIGDVGGNVAAQAYEEVNIGQVGANYGWPSCEGPLAQPKNGPTCGSGVTAPAYSYAHTTGSGCCVNKAIVGGGVYRASMFPLAGYYLYADYPTNQFFWLQLGADGRTGVASGLLHETPISTPVWLSVGPDGAVYWLSLGFDGTGQLRKLSYSGSTDRPPVIIDGNCAAHERCRSAGGVVHRGGHRPRRHRGDVSMGIRRRYVGHDRRRDRTPTPRPGAITRGCWRPRTASPRRAISSRSTSVHRRPRRSPRPRTGRSSPPVTR